MSEMVDPQTFSMLVYDRLPEHEYFYEVKHWTVEIILPPLAQKYIFKFVSTHAVHNLYELQAKRSLLKTSKDISSLKRKILELVTFTAPSGVWVYITESSEAIFGSAEWKGLRTDTGKKWMLTVRKSEQCSRMAIYES